MNWYTNIIITMWITMMGLLFLVLIGWRKGNGERSGSSGVTVSKW